MYDFYSIIYMYDFYIYSMYDFVGFPPQKIIISVVGISFSFFWLRELGKPVRKLKAVNVRIESGS